MVTMLIVQHPFHRNFQCPRKYPHLRNDSLVLFSIPYQKENFTQFQQIRNGRQFIIRIIIQSLQEIFGRCHNDYDLQKYGSKTAIESAEAHELKIPRRNISAGEIAVWIKKGSLFLFLEPFADLLDQDVFSLFL